MACPPPPPADDARTAPVLQLDPGRANWICCLGRKGSGKSYLSTRFWESYPGDRLLIDPNGDAEIDRDDVDVELHEEAELPDSWPSPTVDVDDIGGTRSRRKRSTLRYVPDPRSPTFIDDMDRVVGLAMGKGDCLLWVDEGGMLTRGSYTPPHTRWLLHQGRHRRVSFLSAQPRAVDIDPLYLSQADYVAVFDLPHPRDRERVAATIGYSPADFDAAHDLIERPGDDSDDTWTGFLWWEQVRRRMNLMPPLPPRRRPDHPPGRRFDHHDGGLLAQEA